MGLLESRYRNVWSQIEKIAVIITHWKVVCDCSETQFQMGENSDSIHYIYYIYIIFSGMSFWGLAKWPPIWGWLLIRVAAHSRFYCIKMTIYCAGLIYLIPTNSLINFIAWIMVLVHKGRQCVQAYDINTGTRARQIIKMCGSPPGYQCWNCGSPLIWDSSPYASFGT